MATVLTPDEIKQKIQDWITRLGGMEITGAHLNAILSAIMDYVGEGFAFKDSAPAEAPSSDVPVVYIAGPGTYTGYENDAVEVPEGSICIFKYNGSNWSKSVISILSDSYYANIVGQYKALNWKQGKIIYIEGQAIDAASNYYAIEEFLPIRAGQHIHLSLSANGTLNNVCCLYDTSKEFLSYFQVNDDELPQGKTITVAQDGFLRVCNDSNKVVNPSVIIEDIDGTIKTLYTLTSMVARIPAIQQNLLSLKEDCVEQVPVTWETGKGVYIDGSVISMANHEASGFIPVKSGEKYLLDLFANGASNDVCCIYDSSKEFQSYFEPGDNYWFTGYLLTITSDGYLRLSNNLLKKPSAYIYKVKNSNGNDILGQAARDIQLLKNPNVFSTVKGELKVLWSVGFGYMYDGSAYGDMSGFPSGAAVRGSDYIFLQKGQTLLIGVYNESPYRNVVWKADKSSIITYFSSTPANPTRYYADEDCLILLTSITGMTSLPEYVAILDNDVVLDATREQKFVSDNRGEDMADDEDAPKNFTPIVPVNNHQYIGQVSRRKRYLYVGFDDFRSYDFTWVIPLFAKYGFKATFNRIHNDLFAINKGDKRNVNTIAFARNELGDHTLYHQMYPFFSPLFNGQDPSSLDGEQVEFPTNDQMRVDVGGGKNIFGFSLNSNPEADLPLSDELGVTTAWGELSDVQCQTIRNFFSVMKSTTVVGDGKTLIQVLDAMSEKYLGTKGSSVGSWDSTENQYKGGIFTGCSTSQNHEIWERIIACIHSYYRMEFNFADALVTWSLPGSANGSMFFSDANGKHYYDAAKTQLANCNAKFTSSLYKNADGSSKMRSWTDVLREFGYNNTHDQAYPSRYDGTDETIMMRQMFINASFSRKDAIPYSTNLDVQWYQDNSPYMDYTAGFFAEHNTYDKATEMYNYSKANNNGFYKTIENLRHMSANGLLCGAQWDSLDSYQEKVYWESILRFCKRVGIEVIPKATAYDIAFRHTVEFGNLMYNPELRNTAKEFMPNAEVPANPDGFNGNCTVSVDGNNVPFLITSGNVKYNHFGIPVGALTFSADVKGTGTIIIKAIQNKNKRDLSDATTLETVSVNNDSFSEISQEFFIKDYALTAYEQVFEGYGDKVCGIQIVFSSGLQIKNMELRKQ